MHALVSTAIALFLLVLPSVAQDGTASLTGKVKDITGAGVPGTVAELESEQAPTNRFRTAADAVGIYRFSGLPAGEYDLKLYQMGFSALIVKSILVSDGEQKTMPTLQLAIGAMNCGFGAVRDYIRFLPPEDSVGNLGGNIRLDEGPLMGKSMPISGAEVTLICSADKACGTAKTDPGGDFVFRALPPGDFSLRVTSPGFYPQYVPHYTVEEGLESVYSSIYIERCALGNCDPKLRPNK